MGAIFSMPEFCHHKSFRAYVMFMGMWERVYKYLVFDQHIADAGGTWDKSKLFRGGYCDMRSFYCVFVLFAGTVNRVLGSNLMEGNLTIDADNVQM